MSDDRFVTTDRGLDQGSFSVAGRDLPLHSAISVDRRNVSVSLARRIGVRPFHRIGAWRNDHDSTGTVPGDGVIGRIAVIGAIGRELATARRALRRLPGRQCLRCHPKRQTSAPSKAASYSDQFVTLNFILPMRWRREALYLKGIVTKTGYCDCRPRTPMQLTNRAPCVDARLARGIFGSAFARCRVLTCVRPVVRLSHMPLARMVFAGQVQINAACS